MRSRVTIVLLLMMALSAWLVACASGQRGSAEGAPPVVWWGVDVERTIQMWANIAVILGILGAAVVARLGYTEVVESRKARHAEITLRLFEHYHSDRMRDAIDCIRQPGLRCACGRLDFSKVRADPKVERCFWDVANTFDTIAVLVQSKQWDPKLAEDLVGESLRGYWTLCEPVATGYREVWKLPDEWKAWETYVRKSQK